MSDYETKPNTDLALNEGDTAYLYSQFPRIAEALIWPELVEAFRLHEDQARKLKTGSRRNNFASIVLIVMSLTLTMVATATPFAPLVEGQTVVAHAMSIAALLLLFGAILLGKGVLFGRKRDNWLKNRLIAERLRHLHFQYILANLHHLCSKSSVAKSRYFDKRAKELERVLKRLRNPGYRQAVLGDEVLQEARLVDARQIDHSSLDQECLEELQRYWIEFRFNWQAEYATQQLDRKPSALPLFGSLADQEHTVSTLEFIATLGIVVLQTVAVLAQLFVGPLSIEVQIAVLLASLLAVASVGLQAYKDGMGLSDDLSRNRVYASYTAKLVRDFRVAQEKGDGSGQIRIMQEMEDLAYFETREFLYTHSTARFSF